MDRNLALEFVRVTEAAAIAAAKWTGRGDKMAADGAAVDEMRARFNEVDFNGVVVIGEGKKDEAPESELDWKWSESQSFWVGNFSLSEMPSVNDIKTIFRKSYDSRN